MNSRVTLHVAHGETTQLTLADAAIALDGGADASGKLLAFAVAACHANTLLAEAMARGIWLRGLDVTADVSGHETPRRRWEIHIDVSIDAEADHDTILDLVEHADRVSEVANAVRLGVPVNVARVQIRPAAASG